MHFSWIVKQRGKENKKTEDLRYAKEERVGTRVRVILGNEFQLECQAMRK